MPKYDLNKFRRREGGDPEKADLTIIPQLVNGIQLPAIEWFRIKKKVPKFKVNMQNKAEARWFPKISIDTTVPVNDYKALINWWFHEAMKEGEYSSLIKDTYNNFKNNKLLEQTNLCKMWLLNRAHQKNSATDEFNGRRKDIDKFLTGWLTRALNNPKLTKSEKKASW